MRHLPSLVASQLRALASAEQERAASAFSPEAVCTPHQLAFVTDPNRFKAACCSRRAGKTVAAAVLLIQSAAGSPGTVSLYITLSRVSGKKIVWKNLLWLNRRFDLGGVINRTELSITFPNESVIYVAGAKDESEMEKLRGLSKVNLAIIDEAQSFKDYVQELVDDVIVPALMDTKGSLALLGTPGKVRAGYFYEALRHASPDLLELLNVEPFNDNDKERDDEEDGPANDNAWSVHHWTIRDNPYIPDVEAELARVRKRKRWSETAPTYQREYLGRWVTEHDALVYHYDQERNGYDPAALPHGFFDGPEWRFVHFVDQGYHDPDACGSLAFRKDQPWIWLVPDEEVIGKQGSAALVELVRKRWERYKGRSIAFVWDTGGGGIKTAVDAQELAGVPVEAAKKDHKVSNIDAVNDRLRDGTLKIPLNSQAAADARRVTWDPKARGVKIAGSYHTDIWDGIIYGHRAIPRTEVMTMAEWERRQAMAGDEQASEIEERRARAVARTKYNEAQRKRSGGGLLR